MRPAYFLSAALLFARPTLGQGPCHTADQYSASVIYQVDRMMDSIPILAVGRAQFGVPLVTPAEITLVADSATCVRAGQVVDSLLHKWNPTATIPARTVPIYVYKIGTSYAAAEPGTDPPAPYWVMFFTSVWGFKAVLRMD